MIKTLVMFAAGAAFGMSKYGQPTKEWLKKHLTVKINIVQFSDDQYGIRYKWTMFKFYQNLEYTGKDPIERWCFKTGDNFDQYCKGSLEKCQEMMKNTNNSTPETVVDGE